jgi:hypothetical protein
VYPNWLGLSCRNRLPAALPPAGRASGKSQLSNSLLLLELSCPAGWYNLDGALISWENGLMPERLAPSGDAWHGPVPPGASRFPWLLGSRGSPPSIITTSEATAAHPLAGRPSGDGV